MQLLLLEIEQNFSTAANFPLDLYPKQGHPNPDMQMSSTVSEQSGHVCVLFMKGPVAAGQLYRGSILLHDDAVIACVKPHPGISQPRSDA